jgi:hypothetical protein
LIGATPSDVVLSSGNRKKLKLLHWKEMDWNCQICQKSDVHPVVISTCGHSFCRECLLKLKSCPECRKGYELEHLVTNYALVGDKSVIDDSKAGIDPDSFESRLKTLIAKKREALQQPHTYRLNRICQEVIDGLTESFRHSPLGRNEAVIEVEYYLCPKLTDLLTVQYGLRVSQYTVTKSHIKLGVELPVLPMMDSGQH